MGNWNRRWLRRKKYNQDAPASAPRPYRTELNPPGVWQSSVPSWEKKFCFLVGSIPWQKVVAAKKYMYCYDNVVNWNDSAGEDAFHKAKERFWADINHLPCDIPFPDPDMYIDEIDWNPDIDPELMLDLHREYFNPDERERDDKVDITDQKPHNSVSAHTLEWDIKNPGNGDNPWECSHVQGSGALEDVEQGWNQWDNSRKLDNVDNPWELQICSR
ncbi:hypothetical protein F0562_013380 [Nyssa sinensis]|uniref:Uncharacterized protein n=1 Tax=Nyssa sinensis TaxID=561372 RepID=A0A5J4ZN86_9ASTE|nr:hypothetical protein F0562_013380 [Nyssa sinensis]